MTMSNSFIRIYYQNVNGLNTKINDFVHEINCNNFDVIAITETWFHQEREYFAQLSSNYNIYRSDRILKLSKKSRGGGVCLLVKKDIQFEVIETPSTVFDVILGRIIMKGFSIVTLALHYFPPDLKPTYVEEYCAWFLKQFISKKMKIIFFGDLNAPGVDWLTGCIRTSSYNIKKKAECILELSSILNLKQLNSSYTESDHRKVLDLLLTNIESCIIHTQVMPLIKMDKYHPPFIFSIERFIQPETNNIAFPSLSEPRYCFKRANFDGITDDLSVIGNFIDYGKHCNVQGITKNMYSYIYQSLDKHVPKTDTKLYKCTEYNDPWMYKNRKKLTNKKAKFYIKYKITGDPSWYSKFSELRSQIKGMYRTARYNYFKELESSLLGNSRYFWNQFNRSKRYKGVKCLKINNVRLTDSLNIAEAFKEYYSYNFSRNGGNYNLDSSLDITNNSIMVPSITEDMVYKAIEKLKAISSIGPDNLPNYIIKACSSYFTPLLVHIFNKSLRTGIYPDQWKKAIVIPIHKGGDKEDIVNYRPISILNGFARVFETIIASHLQFNLKSLIHDNQHGFQSGQSTVTNLCQATHIIQGYMDRNSQCDVIYFDFSKAFDSVNHSILLNKLSYMGLSPGYVKWFKDYLTNRSFQVKANNVLSSCSPIANGIPQGSPLGPLLFNVFINDICQSVHNSVPILYADDLKLIGKIKNFNDTAKLQHDIRQIENWCETNKMEINTSKTILVRYTKKTNYTVSTYFIYGKQIFPADTTKDLGVMFDNKLRFNEHIEIVSADARRIIGFIFNQWAELTSIKTFTTIYKLLIRSKLEYAATIWCPCTKTAIDRLESVQRCFIRMLCFKFKLQYHLHSYNFWCEFFNVEPLYTRRRLMIKNFVEDLLSFKTHCSKLLEDLCIQIPSYQMRSHKFLTTRCSTQGILSRLVKEYNLLT